MLQLDVVTVCQVTMAAQNFLKVCGNELKGWGTTIYVKQDSHCLLQKKLVFHICTVRLADSSSESYWATEDARGAIARRRKQRFSFFNGRRHYLSHILRNGDTLHIHIHTHILREWDTPIPVEGLYVSLLGHFSQGPPFKQSILECNISLLWLSL